jgi:hypothetical protein
MLIQNLLPLILCLVPGLAAVLIALSIPNLALGHYLDYVQRSKIDWIILGLGGVLFFVQTAMSWRALRWRGDDFDKSVDHWLTNLGQAAEWFPLMGLLGTVAAILQTFSQVAQDPTAGPAQIIELYAPAMTATASGLFMALINIFPGWMVLLGRDLILTLGGTREPVPEEEEVRT